MKEISGVTLNAVGDICLADHLLCYGFGVRTKIEKNGSKSIFEKVRPYLNDADLVFGNLECVLSDTNYERDAIASTFFRAGAKGIKCLQDGGFTCLHVGNNHILQHGTIVFKETVDLLRQHNIYPIGLLGQNDFFSAPTIIERKNVTVGFLGYCFTPENFFKGTPPYAHQNEAEMYKDIQMLKSNVDFVIASCHWGLEYVDYPSPEVMRIAHNMVESGAHIILGHHPHVLQGVEQYKNSLIFYSLGNFVFSQMWSIKCLESFIVKIYLLKNKNPSFEFIPIKLPKDYSPVVVEGNEKRRMIVYINRLSNILQKNSSLSESEYYRVYERLELWKKVEKMYYLLTNFYKLKPKLLRYFFKTKLLKRS